MTSTFEVIHAPSLVDEVHRQIRARILSGDFPPGTPLRDSTLATQMGTSRSPVREALRSLERSGLVEKSANRSYRIASIDSHDLPELALLRATDEVLAVTRIVDDHLPLETVEARLEQIQATSDDAAEVTAADSAFHAAVVDLAGLPRLSARYCDITDQIRLVLLTRVQQKSPAKELSIREHTVLIDLLRSARASGDTGALIRAWAWHVHAGLGVPVRRHA